LRFQQIAGCGRVHALALYRFDNECRHVALLEFGFQSGRVVEGDDPAMRQERLKTIAKILVAIDRKRAVGQPVKRFFAMNDGGFAGGTAGVFQRRFNAFGARVGEENHVELVRHPLFQLGRQQAGEQRRFQFHQARIIRVQEIDQHAADLRMIAAQAEHAVARKQIEILFPFDIPKIRPFSADVTAIETDGPECADIGRVDVLGLELVVPAGVLLQQPDNIQNGILRHEKILPA